MSWSNKTAFVLICVLLVFTTLAYGGVHHPIIAIFYILTSLIVVFWIVDAFIKGEVVLDRSPLQIPILAAGVYGLIQTIPFGTAVDSSGLGGIPQTISVNPFATQVAALHFFVLGAFLIVLLSLLSSAGRIRRLAAVVMIFGFGYAFFAILQSVLSPDKIYGIYESQFATPFGSFVNRHNFAAYMEMTLAIPLGLMFTGAVGRDKKLLYATAIALMGVALLLSGSRGGLLAFLAQIVFLILLTTPNHRRGALALKAALSVALLAAVVGGAVFVGGDTSLTRFSEVGGDDFTTGRSHIWSVSLNVIKENLPLGAGFGAFGVAYTPHDTLSGLERVEQAHNDYLQVLADAGIFGLLIGGFFLFVFFRTGRRALRIENNFRRGIGLGAFAGCFAVLVHSVFDFVLHTAAISLLFLTLMGLMIASLRRYDDDVRDEDSRRPRGKGGTVRSMLPARPR